MNRNAGRPHDGFEHRLESVRPRIPDPISMTCSSSGVPEGLIAGPCRCGYKYRCRSLERSRPCRALGRHWPRAWRVPFGLAEQSPASGRPGGRCALGTICPSAHDGAYSTRNIAPAATARRPTTCRTGRSGGAPIIPRKIQSPHFPAPWAPATTPSTAKEHERHFRNTTRARLHERGILTDRP